MKEIVNKAPVGLLLLVLLFSSTASWAQEGVIPFTARAYWLEEQEPAYQAIILKINQGQSLDKTERDYLDFYEKHLQDYFSRLSEDEKERYRVFKPQWDEEAQIEKEAEESDFLEEDARGIYAGKKYKLYNGLYGYIYGGLLIPVLGIEESNLSIGLPFLLAGGSLLLPVLNPRKYENMNYNSVLLNRHGKFYGLIDGAALGLLAFGTEPENAYKGILAFSIAGSIAMGEIGFQLGKKVDWTEGRIVGYTHYAAVMPLFATGIYASFVNLDQGFQDREFAALILLSSAAGYGTANNLWKTFKYTRGDMLATSSFTLLSALLGFGLLGEFNSEDDQKEILIPTIAFLAGSIGSHSILKGKNLSSRNGWRVNYVTGAGALVGLGAALIIQPENTSTYLLLPALGGFIGWGAMLGSVNRRAQNETSARVQLSYDVQPQNYFLNQSRDRSYFTPDRPGSSLVNLRLRF